jgi:hypothetical protein
MQKEADEIQTKADKAQANVERERMIAINKKNTCDEIKEGHAREPSYPQNHLSIDEDKVRLTNQKRFDGQIWRAHGFTGEIDCP